jgi:2-dehydro-3-deoxyphosphogluconate aldolase/(4S)-4-hydroxy-2-oxoglutarate aldolase
MNQPLPAPLTSMHALCRQAPVIPVLVIEDLTRAVPLAEALVAGGLPVLEVTLRTPAALEAITLMTRVAGATIGAGTVLTPADAHAVRKAGAAFAVSPGSTHHLIDACEDIGLPLLPGAATATEAMRLVERGFDLLKFFPAEAAGGTAMLKSLGGPLPQVHFCPTGGVSPDNAADYLRLANVACVGGSWVAPKQLIAEERWSEIRDLAHAARQLGNGL